MSRIAGYVKMVTGKPMAAHLRSHLAMDQGVRSVAPEIFHRNRQAPTNGQQSHSDIAYLSETHIRRLCQFRYAPRTRGHEASIARPEQPSEQARILHFLPTERPQQAARFKCRQKSRMHCHKGQRSRFRSPGKASAS